MYLGIFLYGRICVQCMVIESIDKRTFSFKCSTILMGNPQSHCQIGKVPCYVKSDISVYRLVLSYSLSYWFFLQVLSRQFSFAYVLSLLCGWN